MNTLSSLLNFLGASIGAALSTLKTEEKTLVKAINEVHDEIDAVDDYIVEQGTSGDWTYRKWNSGFCEAWGSLAVATKQGQSWAAGLYYSDESVTLPSNLFVGTPRGQATSYSSQWTVYSYWLGSTAFNIRITKPNNQSQSASISLYFCGRWK